MVDREDLMLVSQQDDITLLSVQALLTHFILLGKRVKRHSMSEVLAGRSPANP